MTEALPVHSNLGASSAERWMNCPGSVALIKSFQLPDTEEPDYRREGTAVHDAIAHCTLNNLDAWEIVGEKFYDTEITSDMADNIQLFLDTVRPIMAAPNAETFVEVKLSNPDVKDMFGTIDNGVIDDSLANITDYKNGAGIVVEVENNPQLKYYAYLLIIMRPDIRRVTLRIVQPNAYHEDGPVRKWSCAAEDIVQWAEKELIPAMKRTATDDTLDCGDHCRFCTAKLVCPLVTSIFRAAALANPKDIVKLTDEEMVRDYPLLSVAKMYIKAHEAETLRRMVEGRMSDNGVVKLVKQKANRVWTPTAAELFKERFGDEALTERSLKSPAEMEKISPLAKELVSEYAYKPDSGYTIAFADDKRPGITIKKASENFSGVLDNLVSDL